MTVKSSRCTEKSKVGSAVEGVAAEIAATCDSLCSARSLLLKSPDYLRSFACLDHDLFLKKPVPRSFKINGVFAWLDAGDRGGSQPSRLRLASTAFIVRD